ncbi:hypothetical protein SAY86_001192 [Trapa natans]|uniref:Transcription factor n=1 Tax=Trapa natans TaxID=22666 RepID=A0AAN7MC70_TRANT|nr:hypothetical protein SAY86_001192 [Trapa natans]
MDRASLLSDAVAYIKELRSKIDDLETRLQAQQNHHPQQREESTPAENSKGHCGRPMKVDVKMVGAEAAVWVVGPAEDHPAARLMGAEAAVWELKLPMKHANNPQGRGTGDPRRGGSGSGRRLLR